MNEENAPSPENRENTAAPKSSDSVKNSNVPRLGPVRPSENVPPEISIYDCNSEEEEEAIPTQPPCKRAALSPLKPRNPMVSLAPAPSPVAKPLPKGQASGPSGSAMRLDSQLEAKDSRELTHSDEIYYVYSQRLVELCDQIPKIPKRVSSTFINIVHVCVSI